MFPGVKVGTAVAVRKGIRRNHLDFRLFVSVEATASACRLEIAK
jgi:hypothetical protein